MKETDIYYEQKKEPTKSCLLALRSIIIGQHNRITETRKYGMPCFCIGKKAICYLWTDKKTDHPYILIVEGSNIEHASLEKGSRSRMKILNVDPAKDLPVDTISDILHLAIAFHNKQ